MILIIGKEGDKMKTCWCKLIMAALIIVFVWMNYSWSNIAITVLAALIAVMALWGGCCCHKDNCCEEKKK